jgi:hypothetical protein
MEKTAVERRLRAFATTAALTICLATAPSIAGRFAGRDLVATTGGTSAAPSDAHLEHGTLIGAPALLDEAQVPEPAWLLLFGFGLAGLASHLRHRKD